MRAVAQRVLGASVTIDGEVIASIESGILALVGFHVKDEKTDFEYIV